MVGILYYHSYNLFVAWNLTMFPEAWNGDTKKAKAKSNNY